MLELHPWFAARGILKPPVAGAPEMWATFGLLRRPADAPQLPKEKLDEIQQGHMANIEAMAASGDLAIFVFRGTDQAHFRELAGRDPAIQSGRLVLDLYAWALRDGMLAAKTP